jgi:hypothetical protein
MTSSLKGELVLLFDLGCLVLMIVITPERRASRDRTEGSRQENPGVL